MANIKLIKWGDLFSQSADSDKSVAVMSEGTPVAADTVEVREALGLATTDTPVFAGMSLNGNFTLIDTVYDDMRITPSAFDFAGNSDPVNVATTIGGRTYRLYEFATNDECFITIQMPHGYKRGSVLRPHVHWTPGSRGNEEATKTVAWKADISHAKVHAAFSTYATVDCTSTLAADTVDGLHVIGPSADYVVPADFGESGMLLVRLYRDAGDTWAGTASGSLPLLLEFDIHYQLDKLGSDDEIPS